jgi:hypothetical protein
MHHKPLTCYEQENESCQAHLKALNLRLPSMKDESQQPLRVGANRPHALAQLTRPAPSSSHSNSKSNPKK